MMKPSIIISALFIIFSPLISAETMLQTQTQKKSKDARLFSIAITTPKVEDTNNFWKVYEDALDVAIATGIDLPGELSFTWSKIEKRSFFGKVSY